MRYLSILLAAHSEYAMSEVLLSTKYAGTTHASSPEGRDEQDANALAPCRRDNWAGTLAEYGMPKSEWIPWHVVGVEIPVDPAVGARSSELAQEVERILIAMLGGTAVNSAQGGEYRAWRPSTHLRGIAVRALSNYPLLSEQSLDDIAEQGHLNTWIQRHYDDYCGFVEALPPEDVRSDRITDDAYEAVLQASIPQVESKEVIVETMVKDIPSEAFHGNTSVGYDGEYCGRAPRLERELYKMVYDAGKYDQSRVCGPQNDKFSFISYSWRSSPT